MNRCLHLMVVLVLVAIGMAACTETQVVRDTTPLSDGTEQNSGSGAATPGAIPITPATLPVVTPTSGSDKTKAAPDITPPRVTATNPKSNFKGVSPSTTINVQFSEAVAPKSVTLQTIQLTDGSGGSVEGELACIGKDAAPSTTECWSVSFTPSIPLKDSEDYVLRLTPDIQDLSKNPLADSNTLEDTDPDNIIRFHTSAEKTLAIAAGGSFILALKQNGEVWSWGQNSNGQLGDGTTIDRGFPVRVKGLSHVVAIAAGTDALASKDFSLAIVKDPTTQATSVWSWGANPYGQLGDGTTTDRATPIQVQLKDSNGDAIIDITAIAAGRSTAYALRADGTVWAWGWNYYGQLGNGESGKNVPNPIPMQMPTLSNVKAISADAWHFMALVEDPNNPDPKTATSVWVCGYGQTGQMGNGTFGVLSYGGNAVVGAPPRYNSTPLQVKHPSGAGFLSDVSAISSTQEVLMALTNAGDVLVWGSNKYGGVGTTTSQSSAGTSLQALPVKVMSDVSKLGASGHSSFAITKTGELWGWGDNDYRQLMQSTGAIVPKPTRIGTLSGVDSVASTLFSTVILKDSGNTVMTAGLGVLGQWGTSDAFLKTHNPHLHPSLPAANQVSGRLAVGKDDGYAWAWGRNVDCEMGDASMGSEGMTPAAMAIPGKVTQVANGGSHMLALTDKGEVWAWGRNDYGQLGIGADTVAGQQHCSPVKIPNLTDVVYIAAGMTRQGYYTDSSYLSTSMVIRKPPGDPYGEVWAWGNNTYGQLGNGTRTNSAVPVKALMPLDANGHPPAITQLDLDSQVFARSADGSLYVWGSNSYGTQQNGYGYLCIGNTTRMSLTIPTLVTGVTHVRQVAVGELFSLILFEDGSVKSCGWYGYGDLGTSTTTNQASPAPVVNLGAGQLGGKVEFIAAGGFMAFAITEDGRLWAWGSNRWGQLGTGDSANHAVPAPVLLPDGTPFDNVADVSVYYSNAPSKNPVDSGVVTAIRGDGTVWDWGFLNIYPSFLMWEGEPAFRGVPQTVNWP